MPQLKPFQIETLNKLSIFLKEASSSHNVGNAYAKCTLENFGKEGLYNDAGFPDIPYVCLRLPTGGGKTLLASHTIPIVTKNYLGRDYTLALWLVPSNAILEQTLKALQDRKHWYREVLDSAFDGNVSVIAIEDALYVNPYTLKANLCIIVSTLAAWRQRSTEGRKVYQDNGSLKSHFENIPPKIKSELEHFDEDDGATLKHSLANVVYINRPVLIVDEAHNARTPLTFETLQRLNPSCIVEYTATPQTKGKERSNVLFSVSAATLKAEDIIKMPIELTTAQEWHIVVADAFKKQRELEKTANEAETATGEYIRPIVLIQAEHDVEGKSTINVDEIRYFLISACDVPEDEIAIATGERRGIEGIDLLDRDCRFRFIITKQALKEGWDCPFAYVFCSVATVRSSKDVEQLLGRVLRMPYVARKRQEELNHAYAFVYSKDFYETANNLTDSLVRSGFTPGEADALIEVRTRQEELGSTFFGRLTRTVSEIPNTSELPKALRDKLEINKSDSTITVLEPLTPEERRILKDACSNSDDKDVVEQLYLKSNRIDQRHTSPARRGEVLEVPQLLLEFDGDLRVFDEEVLLESFWNLADCSPDLSELEFPFRVDSATKGLIDVDYRGAPVIHSPAKIQEELSSIFLSSTMQRPELIHWLVKETRDPSVAYAQSLVFIGKVVDHLIESRGLTVDQLVFARVRLREAIRNKIKSLYQQAKRKGFQTLLFPKAVKEAKDRFIVGMPIEFRKEYPVNNVYRGKLGFSRHFYELVGDMNGEEEQCAQVIDMHSNVQFWVRNLERQESSCFWLQTSTDKFYPDFIVKLKSGTTVAIEYKGEDKYTTDDSKEKRLIGEYWAFASKGSCRFFMTKGKDWEGVRSVLS